QTREESSLNALRADLSKLSRVYQVFQQQLYRKGKNHEEVFIPPELESTLTESDGLSVVGGVESKIDDHTRNIKEERQKTQSNLRKCQAFDDIRIHQNMQQNKGNGDKSRSLTDVQSTNASDTFHSIEHDMGDYVEDSAIHSNLEDRNVKNFANDNTNRISAKALILETAEQYVRRRAQIPTNIKRCAIRKPSTILFPHIADKTN
uniref:Uncharacterized protein n=1 Tax=Romanomermis culicivorax TaxID=13658 RepID=A0A915KQH7_ROMCU